MQPSNALYLTHLLNSILMILLGFGWGLFLTGRFKLEWRIFWIGCASFMLSQVIHLPLNAGLTHLFRTGLLPAPPPNLSLYINAIILGLTAGVSEEGTRFFILRGWAKDVRSWRQGLLFGAGHGGMEAIILGALVMYTYFNMLAVLNIDLGTRYSGETLALAQQQISAYWGQKWFDPFLGSLERFLSIPVHLALSILVLQVFLRKQVRWLFLAILLHTVTNAVVVVSVAFVNFYIVELIIACFTLVCLFILFKLKTPEPKQPVFENSPFDNINLEELKDESHYTAENFEDSRFSEID